MPPHRNPTASKPWAQALPPRRVAGHLQKRNLPKNYTHRRGILCWGYCRDTSAQQRPEGSLLPKRDGLRRRGMVFLHVGSEVACVLLRRSASARRTQGAPRRGGGGQPAWGTLTPSAPIAAARCNRRSRHKRALKPKLLPWFILGNCLTQGNKLRLCKCFNTHYGLKNP